MVQVTKDVYERWVTASPIEHFRVEPDDRPEITEGKRGRVNARACAMLMDALDPVVKADLIAREANHSASHILFRLYYHIPARRDRGAEPCVEQLTKSPVNPRCYYGGC